MARRMSGLSNGGDDELTMMLVETLIGSTSQIAADELDRFVGLELDELERPRADRVGAHVSGADMAGIDRRIAGGEQRQQRRLRPLQVKRGLVVA
jgi:hypothetical protein